MIKDLEDVVPNHRTNKCRIECVHTNKNTISGIGNECKIKMLIEKESIEDNYNIKSGSDIIYEEDEVNDSKESKNKSMDKTLEVSINKGILY